ncbi:phosphatidate phosphatase [Powellomyces hirtus]|uniref:phosphatidate phosphatase n=1 Tax=Powellomyces hirtus TaxID=109895 RepID=A0A507E5H5_9FUNG|nr:phosphatidate phosphatase [Powellomyces hirtus]
MTSVVAFAAGKVVSAVSAVNAFYSEVNPSTLSGAIDVVVIKHPDGDLVCSPFHVRFGKLKLLRPHDKAVTVTVNGQKQEDLLMKLGEAGEAFFVVETENPVPSEYATSPIQHAEDTNNVTMEPFDLNAPAENGDEENLLSPTRVNGYHSAHASGMMHRATEIGEDEYPLGDGSTEPSPTNKKSSAEHLDIPEPHMSSKNSAKGSAKGSTKGSELPIDADDVVHLFEHDARMVGMIQTKHDKMSNPKLKEVKPASDSHANHRPEDKDAKAASGSATELRPEGKASKHLDVDTTSKEYTGGSAKSNASDLPIDADDVARSFAHDAQLVGMTQSSQDKDPQGNGIVETTPPGMEERDAKPETILEPESTPAEESTAQDSPPEAKVAIDKLPNGIPAAAADQMDRELFTPNSVMTDDPMVKTANAVTSALESFIPVVPLHALSASASASALIDTPVASAMPILQELMKPPLPHSKSLPVATLDERRRINHNRSSSVNMDGDDGLPLETVDEGALMPGSYTKRNAGPLSDTEVEYTNHEAAKNKKGWTWGWGGLPKKGQAGSPDNNTSQQMRERTQSADPLNSMTVDEKVNNYLAGLPESQRSSSPAGVENEQPDGPPMSGSGEQESAASPLSIAFQSDVEMVMSTVGYDKLMSMRPKEADDAFNQNIVSYETFCKSPEVLAEPSLVVRIQGNYYSWAMAAPMVMANLAYKKSLPEELVQKLHQHHRRPGQLTADNRRYSFNPLKTWWGRGSVPKPSPDADKAKDGDIKLEGVVRGASPEPIKEEDAAEDAADAKSDVKSQQNFPIHFAKSLRLTSEQLKALNLNPGPNTITFSVNQSGASVSAKLFLYDYTCKIVISDIDGTITKSDALGHIFTMVGKDWTHSGIASLYTNIRKNGYHILYLTSRAIGQAGTTREYLAKVEQGGYQLPEGPVIMSPDRLFASFHREVILRRPEEFKMACLRDIKRLFVDRTPFYAGFGNRITDALSYRSVDVPSSRIFTIDSGGEVKLELLADYKSSYIKLNDIVDQIFPTTNCGDLGTAEYNDWNYWRAEFPKIDIPGEKPAQEQAEDRLEEVEDDDEDEYTDDESFEDEEEYDEEDYSDGELKNPDAASALASVPTNPDAI